MKVVAILAFAVAAFAASQDPYVQFLSGLLSTLEPAVGGQVAPCISGTTGGITSVRIGLGLIENGLAAGNVTAVFAGALELRTALADIQSAAANCGAPEVQADIARILNQLETDPFSVVASLIPYASTVVVDLQTAVTAFKAGNFTFSGENIGSVLAILLKDGVSANVKALKAVNPYVEFLDGLITTLVPSVGGRVAPCLNNTDGSILEIRAGIALLKQAIHDKNFTAAFEAAADFINALTAVESAATQCGVPEVATDIHTLITEITTQPLDVFAKLLPHAVAIIGDVEGADQAIAAGNFNQAGQDIGSILVFILQ